MNKRKTHTSETTKVKSAAGKAFDYKLFKRTMRYVKPYKSLFVLTAVVTILLSFMAPVRTLLVQKALDEHILQDDLPGLQFIVFVLLILLVIHALMEFVQKYSTNLLGENIILDLRKELFKHVVSFRMKYFDRTPIGALVTRVTSDIQTITELFSQGILFIISDVLQLVIALAFMYYTNATLANVVLLPVPILIVATIIFKNVIKKAFQEVRVFVSNINTFIQEHVSGMSVVQIFNREAEEMRRFKKVNQAHRDAWLKTIWANAVFFPVVEVLSAASLALLIWWGAKGVIQETATIGDIVAFILYVHMMYRPIRQLADKFNTLQMSMVASERVFDILDTQSHIADTGDLIPTIIKGEIEFKTVHFEYEENIPVLKGISFHVKAGNSLALVGATGAGKTSIINVLTRFYEIKSGEVLIDGVNIKSFKLEALRSVCAVVLQDVFLFNETIYENITLGRKMDREKVIEAAKEIGVHDFITDLPDGYDYQVRERGALLSSGQRQLLAFLRAYLYNPEILILDEATSSVDTHSEILIQKAIATITKDRTSIIIAHRLSTIQHCDQIIVMDQGEIVEQGNHESLLKNQSYYHQLHSYQSF